MIALQDDLGRRITLPAPARRVVSLVPSITESLCAMGASASLVGVTRYCTEPRDVVASIERVGGTKNPDLDRIRALAPDVVLINEEENRKRDFEALEDVGLTTFVTFSRRVRAVPVLLRQLGVLTGQHDSAEALATELEHALTTLTAHTPPQRDRIFCPIWKNPWMSFNRDTYADDMLWCAGGHNVCREHATRYPEIALSEIAAADPEIILLPDEPYVFREKDLLELEPLQDTTAWRAGRVHFIDGKALSWYGPRTAAALALFRALFGRTS